MHRARVRASSVVAAAPEASLRAPGYAGSVAVRRDVEQSPTRREALPRAGGGLREVAARCS